MSRLLFFLAFLLTTSGGILAQIQPRTTTFTPQDTIRVVEVLESRKLEFIRIDSVTQLQIMAGNVRLRQGNSLFWCDSCVKNERTGIFEAFGRVHLNDNDTTDVYADYLLYNTNTRIANLRKNVKLTDGKGILTAPELDYDVNTKIGTYKNGGKVVNDKTVVTSREGTYYSDLHDVYFKKNVELKSPEYYVKTDSILYNTSSETARFIAQTFIKDSSGRTIDTREGFYDLKTGKAEFGKRSVINDGSLQVTGDVIYNNDSLGIVQIEGNGIVRDTAQGRTVIANKIFVDKNKDAFLATQKPVMIIKKDKDSIFITADTLFSARLTDLYGKTPRPTVATDSVALDSLAVDSLSARATLMRDTLVVADDKDSTNRYFEAFRNVRIFSDSLQAICDSLFYSFKDSTFRMFDDPVVWSNKNQVLGDTILVYTKNEKPHRMEVFNNAFIAAKLDPEIYNQIRSKRIDAWFTDGNIDSARARGAAESIYFVQDQDSAYTGVNQSECELYDVYFIEQELKRIVARNKVKGVLWPMRQKPPTEMRLNGFQWLEEKRPKTWFELFE